MGLWKIIAAAARSSPLFVSLMMAAGLCDLLFRYLTSLSFQYLLDRALLPRSGEALALIVGALILLGVLNVAAGLTGDYAGARLGTSLLVEHRLRLFKHMQLQSKRFYDRFGIGDLLARYSDDIPAVQAAILQTFRGLFLSTVGALIGLAILLTMEWRLTLAALVGALVLFLPYRLLKSRSIALNGAYLRELERFNGMLDENIKAFPVIRAFNLRGRMLARVEEILGTMARIGAGRNFVSANMTRLPYLAMSILTALILAYGGWLTFDGRLTIGGFIAFNSVFATAGQSIFGITATLPYYLTARTSLERLRQALDWQPEVDERGECELPPIRSLLSLRAVTFAYEPGAPALKSITADIPLRGCTSIVGPSGSGKSTVLQLLLRFADPQDGYVAYDGQNIREVRYDSLLRQTAVVFQDSVLLHGTIRDNIAVGKPDATDAEIEAAARAAGVHETIAGLRDGYATIVRNYGDNLSGGQRQRIALARALVREPGVLFLDEATSALDPDTERAVSETILALGRSRPIVSVTHRLAYAAQSDYILVLERGTLAEQGTHEQLLAQDGLYRRMWDKQQGFVLTPGGAGAQVEPERLGRLPFFRGIERTALERLAALFVAEPFAPGATVVEQGDSGDKFYLIARGKVDVFVAAADAGDSRRKVATLDDGDHFGEIALMAHIPRTATVVTATPCLLLSLSYDHFHPLLEQYPAIRKTLESSLESRMRGRES